MWYFPLSAARGAARALIWPEGGKGRIHEPHPRGSARTIHAIEKGRPCRQATKRKILITLGVPWELRDEYFSGVRKVRRVAPVEEARSA
jgi:hypothetical protein